MQVSLKEFIRVVPRVSNVKMICSILKGITNRLDSITSLKTATSACDRRNLRVAPDQIIMYGSLSENSSNYLLTNDKLIHLRNATLIPDEYKIADITHINYSLEFSELTLTLQKGFS